MSEKENDDEYLRKLDSLARFYNSEKTVHAGYLITSFVVLVALLSTIANIVFSQSLQAMFWDRVALMLAVLVIVCACYFCINKPWPFLFRYLLGRMQFYMCLSETVWEHMGVTGAPRSYYEEMKDRVYAKRSERDPVGIRVAIFSAFEARMYVSMCSKTDPEPEWRTWFYLEPSDKICDETSRPYSKPFFGLDYLGLLFLAYWPTIKQFTSDRGNARERKVANMLIEKAKKLNYTRRFINPDRSKLLSYLQCQLGFR